MVLAKRLNHHNQALILSYAVRSFCMGDNFMPALNHRLQQTIIDADGRYLTSDELRPLETYFETYQKRLEVYQQISQHSNALVLAALKKFARVHPDVIQKSGKRCQFDMTQVLRYIALSILLDDEFMFQEKMMFWLDTMLRAHRKQEVCAKAYHYLQEVIQETMSVTVNEMVRPFITLVSESLQPYR